MQGQAPRYGEKTPSLHVGRGPVPRHRSRARPCRSRSPDLDLVVIRRSQTTERGERKKRLLFSSGPKGPKTPPLDDAQRGGQATVLR